MAGDKGQHNRFACGRISADCRLFFPCRLADLPAAPSAKAALAKAADDDPAFARWYRTNVMAHHTQGYANVSLSLKSAGRPPGDAAASEMEAMASLAETYGRGELRVTYTQNIIIPLKVGHPHLSPTRKYPLRLFLHPFSPGVCKGIKLLRFVYKFS